MGTDETTTDDPRRVGATGAGRVALYAAIAVALVAIVWIGSVVGSSMFGRGPAGHLVGGGLAEIHMADGTLYLGEIVSERDGFLQISGAAVVIPDAGSSGSASQLLVQLLTGDPYALGGDILIASDHVTLVGAVIPGSGLEKAYRQATGEGGSGAASPSPQ